VCEAVRRLPEKEQQLRLFRLKRALDLSVKHSLLPKEQWTTTEQVCIQIWQSHFDAIIFSIRPGCTLPDAVHNASESRAGGEEGLGETIGTAV
jgi:hypothetical protein